MFLVTSFISLCFLSSYIPFILILLIRPIKEPSPRSFVCNATSDPTCLFEPSITHIIARQVNSGERGVMVPKAEPFSPS